MTLSNKQSSSSYFIYKAHIKTVPDQSGVQSQSKQKQNMNVKFKTLRK